jgi:predicted PurR-regulated permease PerM
VGTHTIYFSVKDDSGAWSNEAMAIVTVNRPITEDPTYQQLLNANQTLNERIDGLTEQNTNLKTQVDGLTEQNSNLTDKIDSLTQSLSTTTTMLLGVGVVTIILVVVAIAVVFMRKPKAAA